MRPEMKISVVLNEFGDTKLESQFIQGHQGDIFELKNGCMCCVAQEDFVRVVRWILEEKPETEYVLIEASGASDPLPVISTFRESDIADKIQLSTVACVVDAVNFFETKEKYKTVLVQVSNSDMALISKVEEAGEEKVWEVEAFVKRFVPRMFVGRIGEALPVDLILDVNSFRLPVFSFQKEELAIITDNRQLKTENHAHNSDGIESVVWKSDKMLDFERVNKFLKGLSANVVRVKGVLNLLVDGEERKFLLQYVGERSEVQESTWEGVVPYSEVVCVGQGIDREKLTQQLNACVI